MTQEEDEDDDGDSTDDRAATRLGAALERPSMALAPREAGLHLWPHDSIGSVNERTSASRWVETTRRSDAVTGAPATGLGGPPRRARVARHPPRDDPRPAGPPGDRPADLGLHRVRPVRRLAPRRPPGPDLRAAAAAARTAAARSRSSAAGPGMIGDPSGRSSERNLLDRDDARARTSTAIRGQLERFLDFTPGSGRGPASTTSTGSASCRSSTSCATPASTSRCRTCSPRTPSRCAWSAGSRSPSSATCSCSRTTSPTCTGRWASSCRWAAPTSGATSRPASS